MIMISYDIENDRMRVKIAHALIRWGLHRIQYSVFLGTVDKEKLVYLIEELERFKAHEAWIPTNSIMILPIHGRQIKAIHMIGSWPERWDEIKGEKNTLML